MRRSVICLIVMLFVVPVQGEQQICSGTVHVGDNNQLRNDQFIHDDMLQQFAYDVVESEKGTMISNTSCYVPIEHVSRVVNDSAWLLVDTRSSQNYARYHIPSSFNITFDSIRQKSYLKDKKIILLDRGYLGDSMQQSCEQLKRAGFKFVGVLKGGLNAWHGRKKTLAGLSLERLNKLTAQEFLMIKDKYRWIIMDFTKPEKTAVKEFLHYANLWGSADGQSLKTRLQVVISKYNEKHSHQPYLLVINEEGRYGELESILPDDYLTDAYYLEGGVLAYERFVRHTNAILRQKQNIGKNKSVCKR